MSLLAVVAAESLQLFKNGLESVPHTCPAMVGQLALGYSCCLIASVAYAVNYLPVKKYDTGDGVFFTFAMSVGILMVGILTGAWAEEKYDTSVADGTLFKVLYFLIANRNSQC